jgi:two-component system chemotaxis response regulator CheY
MKILIAEDAPVNQLLLANFLKPYGDCYVAGDGRAAADIFRESLEQDGHRFDLVCLDIMMPEMDGQAVLQEIRQLEKDKGIPADEQVKVIMITALDDSENIMQALVKGKCEGYLTKPVSKARMQEQLVELGLGDFAEIAETIETEGKAGNQKK